MSEEHRLYLFNPSTQEVTLFGNATTGTGTYVHPSSPNILTFNTLALPGSQPMTISISQYNELLSLYMARGDEITRLQAVVKDAITWLKAIREAQWDFTMSDTVLLAELEQAIIGEQEPAKA